MTEIKRPNYFTYQFLVEKDFDDEQSYHTQMRRRHNRVVHLWGVADGLEVTRTGANQVRVGAGTAIDKDGCEIALEDALTYSLKTTGTNLDVYLTISYKEDFDAVDRYTQGGVDEYTRVTERPNLLDTGAAPPTDGSMILLARIRLNASGAIESDSAVDTSVRTLVSAKIAPRAIGTLELADGAVTAAKLAPNAVDDLRIADGSINTAELADGAVTTTRILDNAVTSAKLAEADGATVQNTNVGSGVKTGHVQDGAITLSKLAANSVDTSKIVDLNVVTGKLANLAVTSPKIADAAITFDKIAPNAVDATKIVDGSIGTNELAPLAVTQAKLGDNAVTNEKILDGAVTSTKILDNAVTSAKLAEADAGSSGQNTNTGNGVKTGHIQDGAVTLIKLAANSVDAGKIVDLNILPSKLANLAVTNPKIADGAVTVDKIAPKAVDATRLADNAVTGVNIANDTISLAKLKSIESSGSGTIPAGQSIGYGFGSATLGAFNFVLFTAVSTTENGLLEWATSVSTATGNDGVRRSQYRVHVKNLSTILIQYSFKAYTLSET